LAALQNHLDSHNSSLWFLLYERLKDTLSSYNLYSANCLRPPHYTLPFMLSRYPFLHSRKWVGKRRTAHKK
jgi:hypothetical protein